MPRPPREITNEEIKAYVYAPDGSQRHKYTEAAVHFGVSYSFIQSRLRRAKMTTSKADWDRWLPAGGPLVKHHRAIPHKMARAAAREEVGELGGAAAQLLDLWRQFMDTADLIAEYDPASPPNVASPFTGGYTYRARVPGEAGRYFAWVHAD